MTLPPSRPAAPGNAPRDQSAVTDFYAGAGTVSCGPMSAISFQGTNAWTIEIWVCLDALVDQMNLVSREGEFLLATKGASLYAARTGQAQPLVSDTVLDHHSWHHVAVMFDGMTMGLYLDGCRLRFVTVSDAGPSPTGKPMTIGGGFYGQTDSARFWKVAVGPDDLYQQQWVDVASGTSGLVAQLDLTQSPPVDTSGNNTPLTVSPSGVRLLSYTPAAALLNVDSFADPYNDEAVNPAGSTADFSVMAWVCPSALGQAGTIFSNSAGGAAGMSLGMTASGNVRLQIGSSTALTSTGTLDEGQWTNVACTWSAATGQGTIYLDGEQDSTGTGMTLGGTLSQGSPLIGAAPLTGTLQTTASFIGYIQSVTVWSKALDQQTLSGYLTTDPVLDPSCVADYDFIVPIAQNSFTLNPVGLVSGAALTVVEGSPEVGAHRGGRPLLAPAPRAGRPEHLTDDDISPAARAALVEDYRTFVTAELGIDDEDLVAELSDRLAANLERAAAEIAAGDYELPFRVTIDEADGFGTVTLHTEEGSAVIYEGELDPCTVWAIWFVIKIGVAVWTVVGFTLNLQKVTDGLTNLLGMRINTIGLVPQLKAVWSAGKTMTALSKSVQLLWEFGVLTSMFKYFRAAATGVTVWTLASLGGRLLLLMGPFAPLEVAVFAAELGYQAYQVFDWWNSADNCWKTATAGAA